MHKRHPDRPFSDIYPADQPSLRLPKFTTSRPSTQRRIRYPALKTNTVIALFFTVLVAAVGFYGLRFIKLKAIASQSIGVMYDNIKNAESAFLSFDASLARSSFEAIQDEANHLKTEINRYGVSSLAEVASVFSPRVEATTSILNNLSALSEIVIRILDTVEALKNTLSLMMNQEGPTLMGHLKSLLNDLNALSVLLEEINIQRQIADLDISAGFLAFKVSLQKNIQLLSTVIPWLQGVNHIVIANQNPSELRPGGGFPGSITELTIAGGSLTTFTPWDIYDIDGQLPSESPVKPPTALATLTSAWETRDSLWFADFPKSGQKFLNFINRSAIYTERGTHFSVFVAVNTDLLADVLSVTGPIRIEAYDNLELTSRNVLDEIQAVVRNRVDDDYPKRIIGILIPKLFERIAALSVEEKTKLFNILVSNVKKKNILAYAEDMIVESYFKELGFGGELVLANNAMINDYVAVINANIGGGKSDARIQPRKVNVYSSLTLEGDVQTKVEVTHTHAGTLSDPWWYQSTNKNYLNIYTPAQSRFITAKGFSTLPAEPERGFGSSYQEDPDLKAIEDSRVTLAAASNLESFRVSDKTIFAGWFNVPRGATKTASLQYISDQHLASGKENTFAFTIQKQSGAFIEFSYSFTAPPGYKIKESDSNTFTYSTDSLPGALTIPLTLIPL